MDFGCNDVLLWREAISLYECRIKSLDKPNLVSLDNFYRNELPSLLHQRNPNPYINKQELTELMKWKLSRGKWRPRLLDFVSSLDEETVKSSSQKAFECLPDISKAVNALTVLKGVGPATASAVLAAYAPEVAPFMSDEAMVAAIGHSKDYTLKQYLLFADKLQKKSKELSSDVERFTPSDVEIAIWSCAVEAKLLSSKETDNYKAKTEATKNSKKKRKRSKVLV